VLAGKISNGFIGFGRVPGPVGLSSLSSPKDTPSGLLSFCFPGTLGCPLGGLLGLMLEASTLMAPGLKGFEASYPGSPGPGTVPGGEPGGTPC
jgi:hypothetical protein